MWAILLLALLRADKEYGDVVVSEVVAIYDGDTFTVNINEWPRVVGERVSVRISGIDTPELADKRVHMKELARAAKQEVVAALRSANVVELKHIRRDKYFRLNAEVLVDSQDLGTLLLDKRLAKPYDGNTKIKWTDKDYQDWKRR